MTVVYEAPDLYPLTYLPCKKKREKSFYYTVMNFHSPLETLLQNVEEDSDASALFVAFVEDNATI